MEAKTASMNGNIVAIPGYGEAYFITREGKVLSAPNAHHSTFFELKAQQGRAGRQDSKLRIRIPADNKWYQLHKLVAEIFIPKPEGCNDVRWKDGDVLNNSVENLEWYYNPNLKELGGISHKAYGWSKWGGSNFGLAQEDKSEEWACQACGDMQGSELPSYMFEFLTNEFIRICSLCQAVKLTHHITTLDNLIQSVRRKREHLDAY